MIPTPMRHYGNVKQCRNIRVLFEFWGTRHHRCSMLPNAAKHYDGLFLRSIARSHNWARQEKEETLPLSFVASIVKKWTISLGSVSVSISQWFFSAFYGFFHPQNFSCRANLCFKQLETACSYAYHAQKGWAPFCHLSWAQNLEYLRSPKQLNLMQSCPQYEPEDWLWLAIRSNTSNNPRPVSSLTLGTGQFHISKQINPLTYILKLLHHWNIASSFLPPSAWKKGPLATSQTG